LEKKKQVRKCGHRCHIHGSADSCVYNFIENLFKTNLKNSNMKKYVLMISTTFPSTHRRKGEHTNFIYKIGRTFGLFNETKLPPDFPEAKLHTIRNNYKLWRKRFDEIERGEAYLSLRYWRGKPRQKGSKQIEIAKLTKKNGIGLQRLKNPQNPLFAEITNNIDDPKVTCVDWWDVAKNDGLLLEDFEDWFKDDSNESKAVIWFNDKRY